MNPLKRSLAAVAIAGAGLGVGGCALLGIPPITKPPPPIKNPAPATLQIETNTYHCVFFGFNGDCWGTVTGSGLKPNSLVQVTGTDENNGGTGLIALEIVDANGNVVDTTGNPGPQLNLECGSPEYDGVTASGSSAAGAPITSTAVNQPSPC
jgi:hypothetical protein